MAVNMNTEGDGKSTISNIRLGKREFENISDRILSVLQKNLSRAEFEDKEQQKSVKKRCEMIFRELLQEKLDVTEDTGPKVDAAKGNAVVEEPFDDLVKVCHKRKNCPYQCVVWTARTYEHEYRYLNRVKVALPKKEVLQADTLPLTDFCGDHLGDVTDACHRLIKQVPRLSNKAENLSKCLEMHAAQIDAMTPPDRICDDSPPNKFRVRDLPSSQIRDGCIL